MELMEKDLQARILRDLEQNGAYVIKVVSGNRDGIPDIICLYHGAFIAIEVKQEGKKPTPLQAIHLERITKAGGLSLCVDSDTAWRSAKKLIREFLRLRWLGD